MFNLVNELITGLSLSDGVIKVLLVIANIFILVVLSVALYFAIKLVSFIITKCARSTNTKNIAKFAAARKFADKISYLLITALIGSFAYIFPSAQNIISKLTSYIVIVLLMVVIDCIIKIVCDFYATKSISKKRPIKGIMQITEIVIFLVLGITMVSLLINQSPLVLIGGIGTFTAILSIVFKDALLGLVAGVQITADDLLRIGDWVEISSQGVEGTVQDISLISVKIRAFDNTMYTIPAYTFLSVPFKNWHTAINEHARRVNKTIAFDVRTIAPIANNEISKLEKKYEIENFTKIIEEKGKVSGGVTNLLVFRELLPKLIIRDERVRTDKLIVCQMGSECSSKGILVDYIFFTKETEWVNYSDVCADKLNLSMNLANELGLKLFQDKTDAL